MPQIQISVLEESTITLATTLGYDTRPMNKPMKGKKSNNRPRSGDAGEGLRKDGRNVMMVQECPGGCFRPARRPQQDVA